MKSASFKTCLRCDWEGDTDEARCPNCGVALYASARASSVPLEAARAGEPDSPRSDAVSPPGDAASEPPVRRPSPPLPRAKTLGWRSGSARSVRQLGPAAIVVVVLVIGAWFVSRDGRPTSPADVVGRSDAGNTGARSSVAPSSTALSLSTEGRSQLILGNVRLSFALPAAGWEAHDGVSMNKSSSGPQDAEAMIFWTSFPETDIAAPCTDALGSDVGGSAMRLAAAMTVAPGIEVVRGPSNVIVGEYPAKHAVLRVAFPRHPGCRPGFFFSWPTVEQGAFWSETFYGDTIEVWIVDVRGSLIVIEAATTPQADADLAREIRQVVASTRFAT